MNPYLVLFFSLLGALWIAVMFTVAILIVAARHDERIAQEYTERRRAQGSDKCGKQGREHTRRRSVYFWFSRRER